MKKWLSSGLAAMVLAGCASGTSQLSGLASSVTLADGAAIAVGAYVVYRLSEMPAWEATVTRVGKAKASVLLEKRAGSLGGDGAASFVFSQSSKKWCVENGLGEQKTLEFYEYWEPTMLGAKHKAKGDFECALN